jgi:hypothetical protein
MKRDSKTYDYLLTFLLFTLGVIQSVLILPIILKFWGVDNFGTWILFLGVLNLIRSFDLGHQTFVANLVGQKFITCKHEVQLVLSSAIIGVVLLLFIQIVIFGILSLYNLDTVLFGLNLYKITDCTSLVLLILYILISGIGGVCTKFYPLVGLYSRAQFFGIAQKIFEIIVLCFVVYRNCSISQAITFYSLVMILFSLITILDSRYKFSEYFISIRSFSFSIGFNNLKKSLALTLNNFLEQFGNNILNSIIVNLFNLATFSFYTTARTMGNLTSQLTVLSIQPYQSNVLRDQIYYKKYKVMFFIYTYLLFLDFIILLPFTSLFYSIERIFVLWTSNKIIYNEKFILPLIGSIILYNYGRFIVFKLTVINKNNSLLKISIIRISSICFFAVIFSLFFNSIVAFSWGIVIGELIGSLLYPFFYLPNFIKNLEFNKNMLIHLLFVLSNLVVLTLVVAFNLSHLIFLNFLFFIVGMYFVWRCLPGWYKKIFHRRFCILLVKIKLSR